jgi:DNA-binding MarR family transcriptional regulator
MEIEILSNDLVAYVKIFLLANRLQTVANMGMREITVKQWLPLVVLGSLDTAPTLKELSELCGITHQSTKRLVKELEKKGFVKIEGDERDKRAIRISVTSKLDEWIKRYSGRNHNFVHRFFSCLSDDEIKIFFTAQGKLLNNLIDLRKKIDNGEL